MWKLQIKGIPGLEGEYDLPGNLTNRELRTVKLMSGVRVGELQEAAEAGDNDVIVAMTAIALRRAGKQFVDDELWDAENGCIVAVEHKDEGADAVPPAPPLENEPDESKQTSGSSSSESGEPSPETSSQNGSGQPGSDIGVHSDRLTLAP